MSPKIHAHPTIYFPSQFSSQTNQISSTPKLLNFQRYLYNIRTKHTKSQTKRNNMEIAYSRSPSSCSKMERNLYLLIRPTAKVSYTFATITIDSHYKLFNRTHDTRISRALLKAKTVHPGHQMMVPRSRPNLTTSPDNAPQPGWKRM